MELSAEGGNLDEIINEPDFQESGPDTNYLKGKTARQNNPFSVPVTQTLILLHFSQKE
jgi:hypothetical protein